MLAENVGLVNSTCDRFDTGSFCLRNDSRHCSECPPAAQHMWSAPSTVSAEEKSERIQQMNFRRTETAERWQTAKGALTLQWRCCWDYTGPLCAPRAQRFICSHGNSAMITADKDHPHIHILHTYKVTIPAAAVLRLRQMTSAGWSNQTNTDKRKPASCGFNKNCSSFNTVVKECPVSESTWIVLSSTKLFAHVQSK